MNLDNQILFFFSALGAFNSTLLSAYFLLFAKPKLTSNYFLGGLLGVLSIRIWKSLFFYFNPELSKIYLQIGLSACFFIGPFLYFYIQSKTSLKKRKDKTYYVFLLVLLLLVVSIGYSYPYENHPKLWTNYFYKIINYQWLLFIIASGLPLKSSFKKLSSKQEKLTHNDVWLLSIFFSVFVIWFAYFTASYTSYITGALSFTFTLYLSILLLFFQKKRNNRVKVKEGKYEGNKITQSNAKVLYEKLETVLKEKKLYKNPNLTLPILARELNIRPHLLSQLLNDNLNKGFSQFINEYRINEAKEVLKKDKNLKMEVIAEMCGFNSKSTFYAAFKKITDTTPAKYSNNHFDSNS